MNALGRCGETIITTSSYKVGNRFRVSSSHTLLEHTSQFLHQSQEMAKTEILVHRGPGGWTYTVPFRFVISR